MADYIEKLCNELVAVRQYLIKIGPKRRSRKGERVQQYIQNVEEIVTQYNTYLDRISKVLQFKDEHEKKLILKYSSDFKTIYDNIQTLLQTCEGNVSEESSEEEKIKMAKFDLKVALSLLPAMTDAEQNTKDLISAIEYYSSTLDKDSEVQLITFVLKTRLSQSARLRLSSAYQSVDELLSDMKRQLLPQKSATALQTKLQQARQHEKSIVDFGKEITELFVDLTISQSEGNSRNYDVLRPINEKVAIRRFADGLRNRRVGTIITARNFSTLKDAIQTAQDEEISTGASTSSGVAEIMGTYQQSPYKNNFNKRPYRGHRGSTQRQRGQSTPPQSYKPPQGRYRRNSRNFYNGNASRSRYSGNRRIFSNRGMHFMTQEPDNTEPPKTDTEPLNYFFRA